MDYWYSHKGETMPETGHLLVVTDWQGEPKCIVEITSVENADIKMSRKEFAAAGKEIKRWLGGVKLTGDSSLWNVKN